MIRKVTGIVLIILADMALVIALAADPLHLGTHPQSIGYKQISLAVLSIVIQLFGIVLSQVEVKSRSVNG